LKFLIEFYALLQITHLSYFHPFYMYKIWGLILEIKTMAMLQMENAHIMLITHMLLIYSNY